MLVPGPLRPSHWTFRIPGWASLLLFLLAHPNPPPLVAQPPPLPVDPADFDRLVVDTLRDVHNLGAELYNTSRDYIGTYRLYHGALLTVRSLLAHRPTVQQRIDQGLQEVEREPTVAHKAFRLHVVIEEVRNELKKTASAPKSPENKPSSKTQEPENKTPDKPPPSKTQEPENKTPDKPPPPKTPENKTQENPPAKTPENTSPAKPQKNEPPSSSGAVPSSLPPVAPPPRPAVK